MWISLAALCIIMHYNAYVIIIMHNNQKYTLHKCPSLTEWINIGGILHNGIFVDIKKVWSTDIFCHIDGLWKH